MRVEISDECVRCGLCVEACPAGAVKKAGTRFVIESDLCDLCEGRGAGKACAVVCPVEAVYAMRVRT